MSVVFLAVPTYNGSLDSGTARALYYSATKQHHIIPAINGGSLLTSNCNKLWASCLNLVKEHGIEWFCLLHSDIEPTNDGWVDVLIDEAEKYGADMMSALVPIKDNRGVTSTAIARPDMRRPEAIGRFTQRQIWHPDFPETFDITMAAEALRNLPEPLGVPDCPVSSLWNNTGCMVVRISPKTTCGAVRFETREGIEQLPDGTWRIWDWSEDWFFSQSVTDAGGKVMATRKVNCIHKGMAKFPSDVPWGEVWNDCRVA